MTGRHAHPARERQRFSSLAERLARSCARGTRQLAFVNELLVGQGYRGTYDYPGPFGVRLQARSYGRARLQHASFVNLRRRLTAVGFIVTIDRDTDLVTLSLPEEEA